MLDGCIFGLMRPLKRRPKHLKLGALDNWNDSFDQLRQLAQRDPPEAAEIDRREIKLRQYPVDVGF